MPPANLNRRFVLLLPLALAACGGNDEVAFDALRYNDLPPIQLNVASIKIEQRFVPSGVPPDVSNQAPSPPVEALKAMASDRLQAFGTANQAVFAILDATLTREGNVILGSMAVSLTILSDSGTQLGFAEARVQSRHTGQLDHIRRVLYELTKSMMIDMNIEFEYQIRRNLRTWLTNTVAPDTPVEQAPLNQSPSAGQPQYGQPGQPYRSQSDQPGQPYQPQQTYPPTPAYPPSQAYPLTSPNPGQPYQQPPYQAPPPDQPYSPTQSPQ
ncbi:hypothetical protein [Rhodopila sp.]|uniref:hypothetical protein n=1 Tax=Rhodopila sp. TaxID=2480087 RepID=UPI003D1501AF